MIGNTGKLAGRTLFISGASRGIGKAIALKAAQDGARVVIAAKTAEPHPKLPGTIYTAAKEIEAAGGQALPCIVDVRDEKSVSDSLEQAVELFGGIDIVVNNASAISLTGTEQTGMKKFDLMHQINTRGTYLVSKLALPHLIKGTNPHILNISPPLNMKPRWFKDHVAYTMAKYGMSMCVLGMSEEFAEHGIAVNALWPRTAIITAAMEMLGGKDISPQCRKPEIMSDAAYVMLCRDAKKFTGNFSVDDDILKEEGVNNFDAYAVDPNTTPMPDFFLDAFDDFVADPQAVLQNTEKPAEVKAAEAATGETAKLQQVFDGIKPFITPEIIEKNNAVYAFAINVPGESGAQRWFLDLTGDGGCGMGEPKGKPDVTFTLKADNFHKMFAGKLKPTSAFMSGKMKMKGDMSKAMKLEGLMNKMRKQGAM